MPKKSTNSTGDFTPTSDDKSENFDYLAQSSDIYPEPYVTQDAARDNAPIAEFLGDGTPNPYYHPGFNSRAEAKQGYNFPEKSAETSVENALKDLTAEFDKLEEKYKDIHLETPDETDDNTVIILTPDWSFFRSLLATCTRFDSETYEPGQWGSRKFTLLDVWCICYRVDFTATDKDIEAQVKTLVKKGILVKEGTGRWSANPILQMTAEGLGITEKKLTKCNPKS